MNSHVRYSVGFIYVINFVISMNRVCNFCLKIKHVEVAESHHEDDKNIKND